MSERKLENTNQFSLQVTAEEELKESNSQFVLFIPDGNGGHESKIFQDDEALDAYLNEHPELKDNQGLYLATRDERGKITVTPFIADPEAVEAAKSVGEEIKNLGIKQPTFDEVLQERQKELSALHKQLKYTTNNLPCGPYAALHQYRFTFKAVRGAQGEARGVYRKVHEQRRVRRATKQCEECETV